MSKSVSFGECPNPRCVLHRHVVQQGNVWHQAADGRAWVTVHEEGPKHDTVAHIAAGGFGVSAPGCPVCEAGPDRA